MYSDWQVLTATRCHFVQRLQSRVSDGLHNDGFPTTLRSHKQLPVSLLDSRSIVSLVVMKKMLPAKAPRAPLFRESEKYSTLEQLIDLQQ